MELNKRNKWESQRIDVKSLHCTYLSKSWNNYIFRNIGRIMAVQMKGVHIGIITSDLLIPIHEDQLFDNGMVIHHGED